MASILDSLLSNVESALLQIHVANGYENTPAKVQRVQQSLTSIADVPAVLIAMRDIRAADDEPYGVQDWILSLEVHAVWVADPQTVEFERDASGNPTENTTEQYASWMADINTALLADHTRGGYAIDTTIVAMEPVPVSSENRLAGVIVDVEVRYRHRYAAAGTAI